MTYQSPPGGNPPARSPGGSGAADPKQVNPLDWGIIAAGVLAFIFSFVSYYTASYLGTSFSASSWSGGFFGWAGTLLAIVGAALVAVALFAPQVNLPLPARTAGLGAFALATLFTFIALFIGGYDDGGISGVDTGHGLGYWVSFIVIIAGTVMSLMRLQATGGQLPGNMGKNVPNLGGYGPQGGISGGGTGGSQPPQGGNPPPPPGYGPPR